MPNVTGHLLIGQLFHLNCLISRHHHVARSNSTHPSHLSESVRARLCLSLELSSLRVLTSVVLQFDLSSLLSRHSWEPRQLLSLLLPRSILLINFLQINYSTLPLFLPSPLELLLTPAALNCIVRLLVFTPFSVTFFLIGLCPFRPSATSSDQCERPSTLFFCASPANPPIDTLYRGQLSLCHHSGQTHDLFRPARHSVEALYK